MFVQLLNMIQMCYIHNVNFIQKFIKIIMFCGELIGRDIVMEIF